MRAALILSCAISLLLLSCFAHAATTDCSSTTRCLPWEPSPLCQRGKPFSLRFMLGLSPSNYWAYNSTLTVNYTVYSFCPNVDELQSFTLKAAGLMTACKVVDGTPSIYTPVQPTNLSVYGFGDSDARKHPLPNTNGTVLIAQEGYEACGSASNVLMASILLLDIGVRKGQFNYLPSDMDKYQWVNNTHYNLTLCELFGNATANATANATNATNSTTVDYCSPQFWVTNGTYMLPAKAGFRPTCALDKEGIDRCSFDADAPCIGTVPGRRNCAKCYANATALANANIQVWTSYFGSDSKGVTLLSGGTNPMTYYKFAGPDIFSNIANQLDSVSDLVSNESGKINVSWLNFSFLKR